MYSVLSAIRTEIQEKVTNSLGIPLYRNRVPESESKQVAMVIRWSPNSLESSDNIDDSRDLMQDINILLFGDVKSDDEEYTDVLEQIKDTLRDFVAYEDTYYIADVRYIDDAGYVGTEQKTTNSVYSITFKVTYGS